MILLLSIFLLISDWCEADLKAGYLGGTKNIYWRYEPQFSMMPKHLCKRDDTGIVIIASTNTAVKPQSRFFIHDNQQYRVITVIITSVSDSDTGEYWCGVFESAKFVYFDKVDFSAMPLTGYMGGAAEIEFLYSQGYEQKAKYLSRPGLETSFHTLLIQTQRSQTRADSEKFSLRDDTTARKLTATIRGLQAEDSGTYSFGMETAGHYIHWPLAVKGLTVVSYTDGRSVTISCKYQRTRSNKRSKHFCRGKYPVECLEQGLLAGVGRFFLRDNAADQVFTVTISNLTEEDAGIYWCVEMIGNSGAEFTSAVQLTVKKDSSATVSESDTKSVTWVLVPIVMLLLLAIGLLVVKYKKTCERENYCKCLVASTSDVQMDMNTAGNKQEKQEAVDYENDDVQVSGRTSVDPPIPPRRIDRLSSDDMYQNSDMVEDIPPYLTVIP
ncbi:polymeric immunoglobulin receptor-like [Sardina pilchardus]|uniref:polymeric immunoglobulin receptor-like n=1 Tax=Sardina pilchardus TaxID=27697 RepID=UPI002E133022